MNRFGLIALVSIISLGCTPNAQPTTTTESAGISRPAATPAPDPCATLVEPALTEYPRCPKLVRDITNGTCLPTGEWNRLLQDQRPSQRATNALGYCAWLELRAHQP